MDDALVLNWLSPTQLTVAGELDLLTAPQLLTAVLERSPGLDRVEIGMAEVSFMDSSGLRALLELDRRNIAVRLVDLSASVDRMLQLSGIDHIFGIDRNGLAS